MRRFLLVAVLLVTGVVAASSVVAQSTPSPQPPAHESWSHKVGPGETSWRLVADAIIAEVQCPPVSQSVATAFAAKVRTYSRITSATAPILVGMGVDYDPADVPCVAPAPPTTSTTSSTSTTSTSTTSTVVPTTTVLPATTTTAAATTTSTAPSTTSTTLPPASTTTTSTLPPSGSADFVATFDTPGDFYDRFQLDISMRGSRPGSSDNNSISAIEWGKPMSGDHDMSCGGPTTQRTFTVHRDARDLPGDNSGDDHRSSETFWWCLPNAANPESAHVMTGMGDVDGYTILAFSPNRPFVNPTRVCWDVNLTFLTGRKWWGVALVGEARYQATGRRLDYVGDPGVDEHALNPQGSDFMMLFQDNNIRTFSAATGFDPMGYRDEGNPFSVADKAKRYHHCMVENPNGTVTIEQERAGGSIYRRTVPGSFPANARVIFLDDSYTPGKDEPHPVHGLTWHWDNVSVATS